MKENLGGYLTAEDKPRHKAALFHHWSQRDSLNSEKACNKDLRGLQWNTNTWCFVGADLLNPRAHRVSRQRFESCSTLWSISGKYRCSYCSEHGSCTSSTTSARAKPYADRTPLYLWCTNTQQHTTVKTVVEKCSRNKPNTKTKTHHPYLCIKTVFIPRARAIAQACWPPAPPKHASTCWEVSWPLACQGVWR